ncbi:hypothetical protein GN956_G19352 [Arapaima gigas]
MSETTGVHNKLKLEFSTLDKGRGGHDLSLQKQEERRTGIQCSSEILAPSTKLARKYAVRPRKDFQGNVNV